MPSVHETEKSPPIEVLGRFDHSGRSIRVQRERHVYPDGEFRMRVAVVIYRQLRSGKWVREKCVGIRRSEMRTVIEGLKKGLSTEPIVDPRQRTLL